MRKQRKQPVIQAIGKRTASAAPCPVDMKSGVTGIEWPGISRKKSSGMLANILLQLEQSQWWTPEQLRAHQFRQLHSLLKHAVQTVPWYRDRPAYAALFARAAVTEDSWEQIPILKRADLQDNFDGLKSREYPRQHGPVAEAFSSGSTGAPVRVLKSTLSSMFWQAISLRDHLWHRRDLTKKLAAIKTQKKPGAALYPAGTASANWGGPTRMFVTGPSAMLNLNARVHEQAEWLLRQKPDYLLSYPSILEALAKFCRDERVELPPMLELRSMSEILRPEVRRICLETWGTEIKDMYSTEETGYIALQCPISQQLLVQAETIFVEVLDQRNRPCAPGERGQVVVTPLHNFAMPLIRYAVGDLAIAGGRSACGRGLPVLEQVLGRTRNMIRLPDGSERFPDYQDILLGFEPVRQFQIVQKTLTQLEMKLVSQRPLSAPEEDRLRQWMQKRFGYAFAVVFTYHAEIPRTRGGKYLDFVSGL